jgi:hypothetical protein
MTQNSIHSLNDPRFLNPFRLRLIESTKKEAEKKSKRKALNSKLVSAVKELRAKWGHETTHFFQQCDKNECGAYLQYKKQPKDKAMPKDLPGRRQRCVEWIGRPSPTSSPYQSDEEENHDADAVDGLLRIANTDLISRASESLEEVYDEDEGGINEENNEYGWGSV